MLPGVKSDESPGLTAAPNLPFGVSRRGCGRLIHPEPLHHLPQRPRLIRGRRGRRRAFLDECRVLLRDLDHLRDRDAQLLNPIALFTRTPARFHRRCSSRATRASSLAYSAMLALSCTIAVSCSIAETVSPSEAACFSVR
ncbi:hypothetical protein OKW38_003055 [Paraburkholderia sp. MM5496-R1]|uniref:hypothetical protein n=1 Tax=Paraburkholderia sp. MM5496-R1 TaxID=2991065 RepID=UPI003D1BFB26